MFAPHTQTCAQRNKPSRYSWEWTSGRKFSFCRLEDFQEDPGKAKEKADGSAGVKTECSMLLIWCTCTHYDSEYIPRFYTLDFSACLENICVCVEWYKQAAHFYQKVYLSSSWSSKLCSTWSCDNLIWVQLRLDSHIDSMHSFYIVYAAQTFFKAQIIFLIKMGSN